MKKFSCVLAFGDSHVAGCELSDVTSLEQYLNGHITIEEADSFGKAMSFPSIVAEHLKIPCFNYAMTGGSNSRSLRLLTEAVQQHTNALVLFGYTCTDRTEFYYPDQGLYLGRDQDNFIQVGMQWQGMIDTFVKSSSMKHPINDVYVKNILRPYNNLKELMFCVDNICTGYALNYLHIPLFPEAIPEVDNLIDFQEHNNYTSWCSSNNFKQLPFLHYDIEAHQAVADLIIKGLNA
jgi:hypothetical protein